MNNRFSATPAFWRASRTMQRALGFSASAFVLTWAASAAADGLPFQPFPSFLQGSYGFTGGAACLFAPGSGPAPSPGNTTPFPNSGFKSNLQPNDAVPGSSTDAFSVSNSVEGIRTFNGDGTGTVKGTSVGITVRPTPGPTGYPSFPRIPRTSAISSTTRSIPMVAGPPQWCQAATTDHLWPAPAPGRRTRSTQSRR
jgi:hypothetical protein